MNRLLTGFRKALPAAAFVVMAAAGAGCASAWVPVENGRTPEVQTSAAPTAQPTPSDPEPTIAPTLAPVPTAVPTAAPAAALHSADDDHSAVILRSPGNGSRLVSPLKPEIILKIQDEPQAQIELKGKGDLLFARLVIDLHGKSGQELLLRPEIPFEIADAIQPVRLDVRLLDKEGRITALASVNLALQHSGEGAFQDDPPGGDIHISLPASGDDIHGKKVAVSADVRPVNDEPIIAELVTEDGVAVNTRLVNLPEGFMPGEYTPLDFSIPYAVSGPTPCLLRLYQASYNQIKGILMLASVPITLAP